MIGSYSLFLNLLLHTLSFDFAIKPSFVHNYRMFLCIAIFLAQLTSILQEYFNLKTKV